MISKARDFCLTLASALVVLWFWLQGDTMVTALHAIATCHSGLAQ